MEVAPSATEIDDEISLTVTSVLPVFPSEAETVDVALPLDSAKQVFAAIRPVTASMF